jgi:hypothetical protein
MRLGYVKTLPSLLFKVIRSPKEKGEQSKKIKNISDNMKKIKYNKKNIIIHINIDIQIERI